MILDYSADRSETELFLRWLPEGIDRESIFVSKGSDVPSPEAYSHVLHTGSSLSICRDAPFVPEAGRLVRTCVEKGIPQFGVCYGHQLLCRALLGPSAVRRNPAGLEVGWEEVVQTGEPMEIPEAGRKFRVLQSHFDEVVLLPEGSEVVMSGGLSRVQGFVNREMGLFGVQFHPEFDRESGNSLFLESRDLLESNGIDVDKVVSSGPSIDTGRIFFGHFLREFPGSVSDAIDMEV